MKVHVFFLMKIWDIFYLKKGKIRAVVYLIYLDTDFLISSSF